jgi:hypothetical protein
MSRKPACESVSEIGFDGQGLSYCTSKVTRISYRNNRVGLALGAFSVIFVALDF